MLGAVVNMNIAEEFAAETVFREHAFEHTQEQGVLAGLDVLVAGFFHQTGGSGLALSAGVTGVAEVDAVGPLIAGELYLVSIDNDYIVATFYVGRVRSLVLAAEEFGNFRAQTTEHLIGGVNDHPLAVYALRVG